MARDPESTALRRAEPRASDGQFERNDRPRGARDHADELVGLAWRVAVLAVAIQTGLHLGNVASGLDLVTLNADSDASAMAWASATATAVAGVGALLLAIIDRSRNLRWWGLAVIFMYLSADDALAIHERAGRWGTETIEYAGRLAWPFVFLPLFLVAGLPLWRAAGDAPAAAGNAIRRGFVCLGIAIALEMASTALLEVVELDGLVYHLEVAVEEALELLGWVVIAGGLFAMALAAEAEVSARLSPGLRPLVAPNNDWARMTREVQHSSHQQVSSDAGDGVTS